MFKGRNQAGQPVTLLNRKERAEKYKNELRMGVKQTNDGVVRTDRDGVLVPLTARGVKYRVSYLREQKKADKKIIKKQEKAVKKSAKIAKKYQNI